MAAGFHRWLRIPRGCDYRHALTNGGKRRLTALEIQDSRIRKVAAVAAVQYQKDIVRGRPDCHVHDLLHRHTPVVLGRIRSAKIAARRAKDTVPGKVKQGRVATHAILEERTTCAPKVGP